MMSSSSFSIVHNFFRCEICKCSNIYFTVLFSRYPSWKEFLWLWSQWLSWWSPHWWRKEFLPHPHGMLHKQLWLASLEAPDDKYVSNFKQNYWLSCLLLIIPTEFRNYSQGSNLIINFNMQIKDFTGISSLYLRNLIWSPNIWWQKPYQIFEGECILK